MLKKLKITIIQPDIVWENKIANLHNYTESIKSITSKPDVIILPEMFTTGFTMNTLLAEPMVGSSVDWMRLVSEESDANIMGSLIIEEDTNIYNRFLSVKNEHIEYYDKKHLFAYAGEDKYYTPGNTKNIITINGWRILLQICYDLRFPVFARNQDDYDAIIYVANWPEKRSVAWKTLLQARAIENQCYVIGVNRVGTDANGNIYSGDSQVIDPLGNINCLSNNSQIKDFELDEKWLQQVRAELPFLKDRDIFELKNHS